MTIFSSGKHAAVSTDPEPFKLVMLDGSLDTSGFRSSRRNPYGYRTRFTPRPEFDHPLTNAANPILAAFRAQISDALLSRRAEAWLVSVSSMGYAMGATTDHISHAREVLTRLAKFTKES